MLLYPQNTSQMFALKVLMKKYGESQKQLHCLFVDLEQDYNRVLREKLWCCMWKLEVAEKDAEDMYENTVKMCCENDRQV